METAEPQEAAHRPKKSQKTEDAPKTPLPAARKPVPAEPQPRTASRAAAKSPAAKSPPKKAAPKAPTKTASAKSKGPLKRPARQIAGRRKDRPESFKVSHLEAATVLSLYQQVQLLPVAIKVGPCRCLIS